MSKIIDITAEDKMLKPVTTIDLLKGEEVIELLSDADFLTAWDALYQDCPWATVFQGRSFVATWYQIYQKECRPILVRAVEGGKLTGLLTLAQDKSGLISAAGALHAEYQVWLTAPSYGEEFIQGALQEVRKQFPGSDIRFMFIPGSTPMKWAETDPHWKRCSLLRAYDHPLMAIDDTTISNELRKKNRREKINRLKRLGELKFERITDSQVFCSVLEELIAQFDFRKGAMFHVIPFQTDEPLKKELLLALFEKNLLHTTILKLNEEIIASNVGVIGAKWVHLQGINTHAPFYAKYSPGILHFLMLGKLLAEEGFEVFDLTPGGDAYKEGLATENAVAYQLQVAGSRRSYLKGLLIKRAWDSLVRRGISPKIYKENFVRKTDIAREKIRLARKQGLGTLMTEWLSAVRTTGKHKIYKITPAPSVPLIRIKRNDLRDLLMYAPEGSLLTRWEFLADAMERSGGGQQVYTMAEGGCLLSYAWVKEHVGELIAPGTTQKLILPQGSAILFEANCHPQGRNKLRDFLITVISEVTKSRGINNIYVCAKARNKNLCRTLEEIGFSIVSY